MRRLSLHLRFLLVAAAMAASGCTVPAETAPPFDTADRWAADGAGKGEVAVPVGDARDLGDLADGAQDTGLDFSLPEIVADGGGIEVEDTGGPQCLPGEGCFLDPCAENGDCLSSWCIEHLGEDVCTQTCVEECPAGFDCKKVAGAEPDIVYACLSRWPRVCLPCTSNQDCKTAETLGGLCVSPGETPEYFCGSPCADAGDCPGGYACKEVTTIDGMYGTQCVPESGVCDCTQKAIDAGLHTVCQEENQWGICEGFRKCEEGGLSACDAAIPAADVCDGQDNNCDTVIDEDTCDDDNPCTGDTCAGADGCVNTPLVGIECTDGDLCTTGDHCDAGTCVGNPVVCDDGNPCTDDSCDDTGKCVADPNHELCDDSNPCTLGDVCDESACIGTPISCDCQQTPDCELLDDEDLCNGILYCDKTELPFKCKVDPETVVTCELPNDADPFCQAAVCAPATGECSTVPSNEGFSCNDNNACTMDEKCVEGLCSGGADYPCGDNNACTIDSCKPDSGCIHIDAGGACDDDNPCTIGDHCEGGQCVSGDEVSCDDGNVCTSDSCAPDSGCHHEPSEGDCDDGNPCTAGDHCSQGFCVPAGATDCNDGNACTTDNCDPLFGCLHVLNNAACDDGNLCTTTDVCQNGACVGTGVLKCNDGNACTTDSCNTLEGCEFVFNDNNCTDDNLCTTGDHCLNGACVPTGFLDCDDSNGCTDDACAPETGCTHTPSQGACDDFDLCTKDDVCSLTGCKGTPFDCDDQVDCTDDICDGSGGCSHPVSEGFCYIGSECLAADALNPGSICQGCVPEEAQKGWSPLTGGVCQTVPSGIATCVVGECELTGCDDGFDDCDGDMATGCEVHLATNTFHCGECDNACVAPENCNDGQCSFECPEGFINCDGVCVNNQTDAANCVECGTVCIASAQGFLGFCNGGCQEAPCPDNSFNLDLQPGNGCEYACAITHEGEELCDDFDNDCDGETDEDFVLASDPLNCGECGEVCGPHPHVDSVACEDGDCAIGACEDGYLDQDEVVLNGCEVMIATGEIWVDAWNWDEEDGSQNHPFNTIEEGFAAAEDGSLIRILPGMYLGGFSITEPNVVVQGEPPEVGDDPQEHVFILGPEYGTGVTVSADNVTIKRLTMQGAATGIKFNSVTGGSVQDASVSSIAGNTNKEAIGIHIVSSTAVILDGVHFSGVTGGNGSNHCNNPGAGQPASGVVLQGAQNVQLVDCEIHDVNGGTGGGATCGCHSGSGGGVAAAVHLRTSSINNSITGCHFYDVQGGKGGNKSYCGGYGNGNIGAGVYHNTGGGLLLNSTLIYDIRPGLTGNNQASAYSACLYGTGIGSLLVSGITCVGSGTARQRGIWANNCPQGLIGVTSSIIANVTEYCLYNKSTNFPAAVMASYSDVFGCASGATYNAQLAGNTTQLDPLFVAPDEDDYHLLPESPCIDTGKTTSPYCNEPEPNGCRVNMGAFGNRADATSAEDAEHCGCN